MNYETDPIAKICAPVSAVDGIKDRSGNGYMINPKALEKRIYDIRRAEEQRREKTMTPEKMRALQVRIDELEAENETLSEVMIDLEERLEKSEAARKTTNNAIRRAQAEIKKLKLPPASKKPGKPKA